MKSSPLATAPVSARRNLKSTLTLLTVLLAAVLADGTEAPLPGVLQSNTPTRFVRVDLLGVGTFVLWEDQPAMSARIATATWMFDRVRFGISVLESQASIDFWFGNQWLPVHVGYTIVSKPRATWRLWGAVPDVHVDAIGSLLASEYLDRSPMGWRFSPTLKLAVCCDVDYYGLGAGLKIGAYRSREIGYSSDETGLFAELHLRVLAYGIGL